MQSIRHLFVVALPLAMLLTACGSTIPQIRVSRPWLRSLQADSIKPRANIRTRVEGSTEPLLGQEELVRSALKEQLDGLLERRGFNIADHQPDYEVKLSYNVSQIAKSVSRSRSRATALGVSIALQVADATIHKATRSTASYTVTQTVGYYAHTISLEFFTIDGELIWKGEACMEDKEPDVIESVAAALQLALSGVPTDTTYIPTVPAVKESHALGYFTQECAGRWFSSPALPYYVSFRTYDPHDRIRRDLEEQTGLQNVEALAAYKDLVTTAEFALPIGTKRWVNPADPDLWSKVRLGGKYRFASDDRAVKIIIELKGTPKGYLVRQARIASDEEYEQFEIKFADWERALKDYFDFFE